MNLIVLSLGSNLWKRERHLEKVKKMLEQAGVKILKASKIYETEPVGFLDQDFFLNQIVSVKTRLQPEELLKVCQKIENAMGRVRAGKNGPRVMDLDILLYKNKVMNQKNLIIPHPRLYNRRFILLPLSEITGKKKLPMFKKTAKQLLDELKDTFIVEVLS